MKINRLNKIEEILEDSDSISINKLCEIFDVSKNTIRRDIAELENFHIPEIDLVIVDLYPFEETVASGADEQSIIEKIDIGGISLIRAAAKNFKDVLIIPSKDQYPFLLNVLEKQEGETSIADRKLMATHAFATSSHYDSAIFNYFNFFYVFIYTMWLKRSTPQNIVIGGAAGAFPPRPRMEGRRRQGPALHHFRGAETAGPHCSGGTPQAFVDDICLTPGPGYLCSHDQTR